MIFSKISTGKAVALMAFVPTAFAASVALAPPGSSEPCNKRKITGGIDQSNGDGLCISYTECPASDRCETVLSASDYKSCGTFETTEVTCNLFWGGSREEPGDPCEDGIWQSSFQNNKITYPNPVACD